jgi:hypothetical protein
LGRPEAFSLELSFFAELAGTNTGRDFGGACLPGLTGIGIGFACAARGLRLLTGTSKCSWGRPRGGTAGLQVGVASDVGFGDSMRFEGVESFDISNLRFEPPLAMAPLIPYLPPSAAASAKPSLLLLTGVAGGNCCESVRAGGGLWMRFAELNDLWSGSRWDPTDREVMIEPCRFVEECDFCQNGVVGLVRALWVRVVEVWGKRLGLTLSLRSSGHAGGRFLTLDGNGLGCLSWVDPNRVVWDGGSRRLQGFITRVVDKWVPWDGVILVKRNDLMRRGYGDGDGDRERAQRVQ